MAQLLSVKTIGFWFWLRQTVIYFVCWKTDVWKKRWLITLCFAVIITDFFFFFAVYVLVHTQTQKVSNTWEYRYFMEESVFLGAKPCIDSISHGNRVAYVSLFTLASVISFNGVKIPTFSNFVERTWFLARFLFN